MRRCRLAVFPRAFAVPCVAALLGVSLASSPALAQESAWPARTVQLIVPYTPATGADILARILGPKLSAQWKVPVVTENRVGATGNIGAEAVARASPDGYTLLFTATSFAINPAVNPKLPFDPVTSFTPVALIATSGMALVVTPGIPARTLHEFVALAKSEPGKMYYSSPGNGGPQHLAMELVKLETGVDLVHVPYKGSGGALSDLISGHVQAMVGSLQTVAPYVRSGTLRMLAVLADERSPAFPDVPTTREEGFHGLRIDTWYAVFAPAGTPAAIVEKINADIDGALQMSDVRDLLARQGMTIAGGSPGKLAALLKAELARWAHVVGEAHITAD
jgi:tripartite-type tricarboxylate transporter receptor subunit TctC